MSHRVYLDVSAVRIQAYLARTPKLKGRRSASAALAEATRLPDGDPLLRSGRVSRNPEAGEADGVISLVWDVAAAAQEKKEEKREKEEKEEADAAARATAGAVFAQLRKVLPGAAFQAVWGVGSSYLEVYDRQIGPRLRRGDVLADLPAVRELAYAVTCRICHLDASVRKLPANVVDDEPTDACPDCYVRFSRESKSLGKTAEAELLAAVAGAEETTAEFPELARLGAGRGGRKANHLAHVFVDGNAFGDFFHHLARHGGHMGADAKAKVSRDLNAHTRTALTDATGAVRAPGDGATLPVVPHVVGGDDVLLTLPADRAWRFVRVYLDRFGKLTEATRRGIPGVGPGLPRLSASAGVVFAHHKLPFNLAVEAAEERLRAAKSLVRGREASVAFTDLTTDGSVDRAAAPVRLEVLQAHAAQLDKLARQPAAFRTTLAEALRTAGGSGAGETRARTTAARLGRADVIDPFVTGAAPPALPLAQALRLVRWWR